MLCHQIKNFITFQEKKSHRWTEFSPKPDFKAYNKKYRCSWQAIICTTCLSITSLRPKESQRSFCPGILPPNHTHSTIVRKETYLFYASHLELRSKLVWCYFLSQLAFQNPFNQQAVNISFNCLLDNWTENWCFTISLSHLLAPTQDKSAKGWLTKYPKLYLENKRNKFLPDSGLSRYQQILNYQSFSCPSS